MTKAELIALIERDADVRAAVKKLVLHDARVGEVARVIRDEVCRQRRPHVDDYDGRRRI